MKRRYIKAELIKPTTTTKINNTAEQQDKIARLYALADKLHVKIGGNYEQDQHH